MLTKYKGMFIGGSIMLIVVWYYMYTTQNKIDTLKNDVAMLESRLATATVSVVNRENTIQELEVSISSLTLALVHQQEEYETLDVQMGHAKESLSVWRSMPPKIKYIKQYESITAMTNVSDCTEGLRLNKEISELDYGKL